MISIEGRIYKFVEEDHIAYHAKIEKKEAELYSKGYNTWCEYVWKQNKPVHKGQEFTGYRTWRDTWLPKKISSPLDLVSGRSPNTASVGIELQASKTPTKDIFTDEQYAALQELVKDISLRHNIHISRTRLLGHYDVSPMRRSTSKGGWDPGDRFSWNRLFDYFV